MATPKPRSPAFTAEAEVAQGTFYLHFDTRQALLDELLPAVAAEISASALRERRISGLSEEEQEIERCRAFFDVLNEVPEFFRILNEAEMFAPDGYRKHIAEVVRDYAQILRRGFDPEGRDAYTDQELSAIVHILLGARTFLAREYAPRREGRGRSGVRDVGLCQADPARPVPEIPGARGVGRRRRHEGGRARGPPVRSGHPTAIDDGDSAVLRLTDAVAGRHQQVALALGDDLDLRGRDALLLELGRD